MQLVKLSGTARIFDEVLPNIADQAKNAFIRANPQMQLGIIERGRPRSRVQLVQPAARSSTSSWRASGRPASPTRRCRS